MDVSKINNLKSAINNYQKSFFQNNDKHILNHEGMQLWCPNAITFPMEIHCCVACNDHLDLTESCDFYTT